MEFEEIDDEEEYADEVEVAEAADETEAEIADVAEEAEAQAAENEQ